MPDEIVFHGISGANPFASKIIAVYLLEPSKILRKPLLLLNRSIGPVPRRRGSKFLPSERIAGSSRIGTGFEDGAPIFLSGDSCAHTTGSRTDNLVTHLLKRERDIPG